MSRYVPSAEGTDDEVYSHPLEIIPFFTRFPRTQLRNYIYTFIFSLLIGLGILLVNMLFEQRWPSLTALWRYVLLSLLIGYSQHLGYQFLIPVMERLGVRVWWISVPVVSVLAILLAFTLFSLVMGTNWLGWTRYSRDSLLITFLIAFALALLTWGVLRNRARVHYAELAVLRAKADTEAAQREKAIAELKTLRAQVEPHFLYNTLANVVSLIDRDPANAKHMTERLIGYLRHTLDASRREDSNVGDELAIVADYLEILRLRMGERLRYQIDVNEDVRALPLPPMLLQPLVENAIKHGLEPKIEGGSVHVKATVVDVGQAQQLHIQVVDDGLGFGVATDTGGSGSGLNNVRGRLRAMYGDAATLKVAAPPVGTIVELTLPVQSTT